MRPPACGISLSRNQWRQRREPALVLGRHVMPYFEGKTRQTHRRRVTKAAYEARGWTGAFSNGG